MLLGGLGTLKVAFDFRTVPCMDCRIWQVNDHRKRQELTMKQPKTTLSRSRNLKGLVFLSPEKQLFCVTDVRATRKLIPRQIMCLARSQKAPYEGAAVHKRTPASMPCVTDVLCNWDINSQTKKIQGGHATIRFLEGFSEGS